MNISIPKERALVQALGKGLRRPYRRGIALEALTERPGRAGSRSPSPISAAHDENWWRRIHYQRNRESRSYQALGSWRMKERAMRIRIAKESLA